MFWFGRPPYWRWVAAGLLVLGAAALEFRPTQVARHPFTAAATAAGAVPEIEWREVPAGVFEPMTAVRGVASHPLEAGEPLAPSDLAIRPEIPTGWLALAVELPAMVAPGAEVQLVRTGATAPPIAGLVVGADESGDGLGSGPTALVAVPAHHAPTVATASADRSLVVLIAP